MMRDCSGDKSHANMVSTDSAQYDTGPTSEPSSPARTLNDDSIVLSAMSNAIDKENVCHESAQPISISLGKNGKPEHWLERTEQKLPENNLYIVFTGLMLVVFLSALDQTICATALPTISAHLHMSPSDYSWVGSAYLLAGTGVIPLYGRVSDIVGRKPMLWIGMALFLFGSAMCGAAQSPVWLCVCRGVQGLGGGGTISLANILIGDLVPLKDRGTYAGLYGFVWGLASVLGPVLGGIISQHASWRWIFFLNLPVGAAAFLILYFCLHLNHIEKKSARQYFDQFDLVGYLIILAAVILFLLGFTFAETLGFQATKAIIFIVVGACLFPIFVAYEFYIERKNEQVRPIVPPRLFRTRTTALILVMVATHSMSFFAAAYYLPLYYQAITGSSATLSAAQMLPFSLISSLTSAGAGFAVTRLGRYRPIIWASFAIYTLGMGLMTMLDAGTSIALQEIYPGIAGFGLGALFQTPLVALTAAMPPDKMATSVASFALVRTASGTVGIAVAGSIFNSGVMSRVKNIPGYSSNGTSSLQGNLQGLVHLQPPALAHDVIYAYGDALRLVWIVLTPIIGVGFIASLGIKGYSLNRRITREDSSTTKAVVNLEGSGRDVEQQEDQVENDIIQGEEIKNSAQHAEVIEEDKVSKAVLQGPEASVPSAMPILEREKSNREEEL